MNYTYKMISIYVDHSGNLIIIPTTRTEKQGVTGGAIVDINVPHRLNATYNDKELEDELMKAMEDCYTKDADSTSKVTPIEKILNIKSWGKAVKDKKLVDVSWTEEEGYQVTPTQKEQLPKRGYIYLEDQSIKLGKQLVPGKLAKAIKEAIKISTI
jgi:hypothetical protein